MYSHVCGMLAGARFRGGGQASGYRSRGWFSSGGVPGSGYSDSHDYHHYTGGLSEEEQYRRAMENSRYNSHGQSSPSAPQPPQPPPAEGRLYPDLELLRERRTARYQ